MSDTLCTDCVQYVANAETPPDEAQAAAWRDGVALNDDGTPGYWVVTCQGDDDEDVTDEDRAHVDFSNARCGMCGTTLAGDRCPAEWVPDTTCTKCEAPGFVDEHGVSHHSDDDEPTGIDHDADERHVALFNR